ncbi:MAG: hypothetical protein V4623_04895 [Pseudomonadota bacterium]
MKKMLLAQMARYDALKQSERWLIALVLLGGLTLAALVLYIDPLTIRLRLAERELREQQNLLATQRTQLALLKQNEQTLDTAAQRTSQQLAAQIAETDNRLSAMNKILVPPQAMRSLLEDLIGRDNGLRLLSLRTLAVTAIASPNAPQRQQDISSVNKISAANTVDNAAENILFKHAVEIRLEGKYQNLARYLAALEQAPIKVLWDKLTLTTEEQPRLVLTLTVFTLSLEHTWLTI